MNPSFSDIVIAVVTGIVSSFLMLFVLALVRPNLALSPKIVKFKGAGGQIIYKFKIANRSYHAAVDVTAEAFRSRPNDQVQKSSSKRLLKKRLRLKTEFPLFLTGRKSRFKSFVAIQERLQGSCPKLTSKVIRIDEDVDALLNEYEGSTITIRLWAKHNRSGTLRYWERTYDPTTDIVFGEFMPDSNVGVVELEQLDS